MRSRRVRSFWQWYAAIFIPMAPRSLRKVRVRAYASCRENFYVLALVVWGNYDFITNFYVDFRDNIEKPRGYRRIPLIGLSPLFSELLVKANNCDLFRMIPPKGPSWDKKLDWDHAQKRRICLSIQRQLWAMRRRSLKFEEGNPGHVNITNQLWRCTP